MRRKKRKKIHNKHSKQEKRTRFNAFKGKIHHYLKLLDCEEVSGIFDDNALAAMFKVRSSQLPRLRVARGVTLDAETRKRINTDIEFMMSQKKIMVNEWLKVSAKEVFQYLATIEFALRSKKEKDDFKDLLLIEKYREKVPDFEHVYEQADEDIRSIFFVLGVTLSRMNASLYWFERIEKQPGDHYKRYIVELREHIPKKHKMVIERQPRPVYPICMALPDTGPIYITIPSDKIKLPGAIRKLEIPVYFQNHLLHRLDERLDCIAPYLNQFFLFLSLLNPRLTYFRDKILVEFIIDSKIKLGYILLEFHKDRLLAKTFLLLSNAGTPEGDKLKEISGMEKNDLSYWAIDKLSTYHRTDLKDHPRTRAMFEDAGCGDLFKKLSALNPNDIGSATSQARQMIRYLEGAKDTDLPFAGI